MRTSELTVLQRAGDYVLTWSEVLDTQYAKLFGGTATKATLVKRGPKESLEDTEQPTAKRAKVKAEHGTADLENEVRQSYEKGAISKVKLTLKRHWDDTRGVFWLTHGE